MMSKLYGLRVVFFASLLAYGQASYSAGNVNGSVGVRQLDKSQWAPLEQQSTFGVLADFSLGSEIPLYASVGLQVSAKSATIGTTTVTASIADFTAGMKVMPRSGTFRPYFGAGIARVGAAAKSGSIDVSDSSSGYYIGGGAVFRIGRHFNLGADLRMIGGTKIAWNNYKGDANSYIGSVLIGYGWD